MTNQKCLLTKNECFLRFTSQSETILKNRNLKKKKYFSHFGLIVLTTVKQAVGLSGGIYKKKVMSAINVDYNRNNISFLSSSPRQVSC